MKVANLHIASGWVPANCRPEDFASAIRTVCEPIFEKPLKDISFGLLILRLIQVARRFHMIVQPQLILLQKTLLAVEGLGRQIYPDLDLWQTAKPFLEKWVKQQMGPKAFLKHCKENLPFMMTELPHMPKLLNEVLSLSKQHYQLTLKEYHQPTSNAHKKQWRFYLGGVSFFTILGMSLSYWIPTQLDKNYLFSFFAGAGLVSFLGFVFSKKN